MKPVRPTSRKVLQALFNILGPVTEERVLDLFAGTGRVGGEALRRGAGLVVMVERDRRRAAELRRTAPQGSVEVLAVDVRKSLPLLERRFAPFHVVFADPPYGDGWEQPLLGALFPGIAALLRPRGVFVLEHSSRVVLPETPAGFERRDRTYGETVLTFLERTDLEA
ncbi:MAG: RsmD family RNA methyltransferase [Synergistales bacterium]|nr:RsmD family RNA methyltransferase [Synergistales bacterium]